VAREIVFTFVTNDGRWVGQQRRVRAWEIGDTIVREGPRRRFTTWLVVDVAGTRVTLAPADEYGRAGAQPVGSLKPST
jgi:hypothetical protein